MSKITKYSIPVLLAGLVFTGRTEDTTSQPKKVSDKQQNQQSTFQPGEVTESQLKKQVTPVNKASSFIGMGVKNLQNEDIGKINDLVFDPQKGKISYAVLSIGGILGVGDKLIAVPVTSLKAQPGQNHLVLNMQKSQLESAPGLAAHNWPDLDAPGLGGSAGSESGTSSGSSPSSSTESSTSGSNSDASASISAEVDSDKKSEPSSTEPEPKTSDQ